MKSNITIRLNELIRINADLEFLSFSAPKRKAWNSSIKTRFSGIIMKNNGF